MHFIMWHSQESRLPTASQLIKWSWTLQCHSRQIPVPITKTCQTSGLAPTSKPLLRLWALIWTPFFFFPCSPCLSITDPTSSFSRPHMKYAHTPFLSLNLLWKYSQCHFRLCVWVFILQPDYRNPPLDFLWVLNVSLGHSLHIDIHLYAVD